MTIQDCQKLIKNRYGRINESNNHNHDFFLGYIVRTVASAFKKIRNSSDPSEKFAKSIAYIFGLAELCKMDLQTSFLKRFPNACPYCLKETCKCYSTNKKAGLKVSQEEYSGALAQKETTFGNEIEKQGSCVDFDYIANMINSIYPLNRLYWKAFRGPEFHISKCLEELGEIQEAYSIYLFKEDSKKETYLNQIHEEICDLFAWIISAWSIYCENLNITHFFEKMYKDSCPSCNQEVCICKTRNNSPDMLWGKDEIENIYNLLSKLNIENDELKVLLKQFEDALESNRNTDYKKCIKKAVDFLSNFQATKADKHIDDIDKVLKTLSTKI